ncbi:MAG TPA: class I SAM-dependent methyltransferase [Pirellulales bacterium]|nr:class I SAM-dependent methyltransferase [Pirellulales bacterium]
MDPAELFTLAFDCSERSGWWGSALPFLYGLAVGCRAKHLIEIGVCQGGSTRALLYAASINAGHLTSIDIVDCSGRIAPPLNERWTFVQGDSRRVLPAIDFPIDFALIDGEHTADAVSAELREIDRLMMPRGSVVLDDCWPEYQGVLDAFERFRSSRNIEKTLIRYGTERSLHGTARRLGLIRYV